MHTGTFHNCFRLYHRLSLRSFSFIRFLGVDLFGKRGVVIVVNNNSMKVFSALHTFAFLQSFQSHQLPTDIRQKHQGHSYSHPVSIAMAESCDNATKVPTLSNRATASTLCEDDVFDDISTADDDSSTILISSILPPLPAGSRRIYLLRHGETDWNLQGKIQGGGYDIPLNENGRQQALTTALALEDIPLGVVVSSHLSRAKETADILWGRHNSTVQDRRVILNGFAEMSFGEFEGLAWRDQKLDPALSERFKTISKQLKQDVDEAFPGGGESTRDVAERSTAALKQVLDSYPDQQHIAIVSHGRTNKVIIAASALGDVMQYPTVKQGNTCINVLDIDADSNWTVQTLNFLDHVKDNVIVREAS